MFLKIFFFWTDSFDLFLPFLFIPILEFVVTAWRFLLFQFGSHLWQYQIVPQCQSFWGWGNNTVNVPKFWENFGLAISCFRAFHSHTLLNPHDYIFDGWQHKFLHRTFVCRIYSCLLEPISAYPSRFYSILIWKYFEWSN